MRRLLIAAWLVTTLRAEFGLAAAARRDMRGPETLPAEAYYQRTIDALLADE